jgi:hypothetical protein
MLQKGLDHASRPASRNVFGKDSSLWRRGMALFYM